jgi:type IV pilus assembly protein PilC
MPVYQWVGKNRKDEVQKGEIDAVSEEAVKAQLARQRITPTKVKKNPKTSSRMSPFFNPQSNSGM